MFRQIVGTLSMGMQGRIGILKVHSRNKKIEEGLDYNRVARATAGFTGAELMNLMNTAAVVAVRRGAKIVTEGDVFQVRIPAPQLCSPTMDGSLMQNILLTYDRYMRCADVGDCVCGLESLRRLGR